MRGDATISTTAIQLKIIPPAEALKRDVECFRIASYTGEEALALKVSPNGMPGIVFQHDHGRSGLESILTPSGSTAGIPTSFVYKAGTEPSVMNYRQGPYTTTQVILKPHALRNLLGLNAAALTGGLVELNEFSREDLNARLVEARSEQDCITILTNFLLAGLKKDAARDQLVEESLSIIQKNSGMVSVQFLLERLHISERQFEKRFNQAVGVTPQAYIRMKRFNEAIRLMKAGRFQRLTDVAHALNYHDQSHFIHDFKSFSGITPRLLTQKGYDFYQDQVGAFYL